MELPHDLVEEILSRLSVKSLIKFKSVSRRWKWTIESQHFKKKHMTCHQSLDSDLLLVDGFLRPNKMCVMRMLESGSSVITDLYCPYPPPRRIDIPSIETIDIPSIEIKITNNRVTNSCDGMVCFYDHYGEIFVVNPNTRWYRKVHRSRYQELRFSRRERGETLTTRHYYDGLGFGKDVCTGAYKLVWLYYYCTLHQESVTTCEVFEFGTNTWRYVKSPPYEIYDVYQNPVYVDGSVHWLINANRPKRRVLSFDFHKETFKAILELPTLSRESTMINICTLNNRLCLSEKSWPKQNIWVLNSRDNTWEKMYSLDLPFFPIDHLSHYETNHIACPLAILKKKYMLLLYAFDRSPSLVIYDHDLRLYHSYGKCLQQGLGFRTYVVPYFPSLISIP